MQTSWILPLKIIEEKCKLAGSAVDGLERYHVTTCSDNTVGPRLLKGASCFIIDEWGPFFDREEAVRLKEKLEKHIEAYETKKRKRGKR